MTRLLLLTLFISNFCFSQTDTISIYFTSDSYSISEAEKEKLAFLKEKDETDYFISLIGRTDSDGNERHNEQLSKKRVEAVKEHLIGFIINRENYLGELNPTFANDTEVNKAKNRRVDVILTIIIEEEEAPPTIEKSEENTPTLITLEKKIDSLSVGDNLVLPNLEFIGGRHYITKESYQTLYDLLSVMEDNPNLEIEIQGHICCSPKGEDGFDFDNGTKNLSVTRAFAIYVYLVKNGVDKSRLSYRGMKGDFPLYKETSEEMEQKNRRVEIVVVKM